MNCRFILAGLLFAFLLSPADLRADIILEYNTAASTTNASLSPTNVNANVSGDSMVTGGGLAANAGSTWNWRGWDTDNLSFGDAVADGDTWLWGFDVTGDVTIDLTSFDIRVDRSGSGADDFEIQVSVNGGAGVSVLTHDFNDSGSGVNFDDVDLSSIATLNNGDSVVFTLGAFNSESTSGTFDLETFSGQTYGLQINGDISALAVPEPTSLGLLGIVAGSAFLYRRRKQKASK